MTSNIRPELQALLSYLILLSGLILLFNLLINPTLAARQERLETISTLHDQNVRFLQSIYDSEFLMNNTDEATQSTNDEEYLDQFITAGTSALAGAQLQSLLRTLIEESGAVLVSAAFRRSNETTNFPQITVSLRLQSSINALQSFLLKAETHSLALFVENLVIQSRHREGRQISNINEELEVRMDVSAFLDMNVEVLNNGR
ncbi:MAG: hypothetical protein CMP91_11920 [Gammaproteobacteria bacterium]|nr:hypothetical protein [Gammaproteobacteria bacterium]|tara:strand:- start:2302 stop:2907 length:606 start_codon:yes stop_codon:yes gene_type:complete